MIGTIERPGVVFTCRDCGIGAWVEISALGPPPPLCDTCLWLRDVADDTTREILRQHHRKYGF